MVRVKTVTIEVTTPDMGRITSLLHHAIEIFRDEPESFVSIQISKMEEANEDAKQT